MKLETIYILQHKFGNKNWEDEPSPQYTLLSFAQTALDWRNGMNELGTLLPKLSCERSESTGAPCWAFRKENE